MLQRHFNEAFVLYICASTVCTLGILQDNGLFLSWQVRLVGKHCFECSLFNASRQIMSSSTCTAHFIQGAVQITVTNKTLWQNILREINRAVSILKTLIFCRRSTRAQVIFAERSDFYVCLSFNHLVLYYWNDDLRQQKCWPALLEKTQFIMQWKALTSIQYHHYIICPAAAAHYTLPGFQHSAAAQLWE